MLRDADVSTDTGNWKSLPIASRSVFARNGRVVIFVLVIVPHLLLPRKKSEKRCSQVRIRFGRKIEKLHVRI